MTEYQLQVISIVKMLVVVGFSLLYSLGGIRFKWIRRYIACVFLGISIWGIGVWQGMSDLWYLLFPLLLMGALTLGYGAEKFKLKIARRGLAGTAIALAALPIAIRTGNWKLYSVHAIFMLFVMTYIGVLNPMRNARDEETIIGTFAVLLPVFMV